MSAPSLASLQRGFWQALTEGAAAEQAGAYHGTEALTAVDRLGVYADMYLARLQEALAQDFPQTAKICGDALFASLCADYLRAHPSQHPSIAHVGQRLPAFLRERLRARRRDLGDLAALEWERAAAFVAPDGPTAAITALAGHPADRLPLLRLKLHPRLRLLTLEHDVAALWRTLNAFEMSDDTDDADSTSAAPTLPPPSGEPGRFAVWRDAQSEVCHTTLTAAAATGLARAAAGESLAQVCDAFAQEPSPEAAAFEALGAWFADGWIASVQEPMP